LKEKVIIYSTISDQETIKLGKRLGELLKEGDVVALVGELGSGKTWFAKGLALGLGVGSNTVITSPSFALVNEYEGKSTFYHMDLYRLQDLSELHSAGLDEYLQTEAVVIMEWADRWPEMLPDHRIKVALTIIDDSSRKIVLSGHHHRALELLSALETEK